MTQHDISIAELEFALSCVADIVERYGDKYLPLFLRLETALDEAYEKRDLMVRVRKHASQLKEREAAYKAWGEKQSRRRPR